MAHKEWEIWGQGKYHLGNQTDYLPMRAVCYDIYMATSFDEAIGRLLADTEEVDLWHKNETDGHWYYFGQRVYDNEEEARKIYG